MKKFIGIVLVLCSLALPLAGCKEAISTVTCNTISELEDIPGQILSTPESAETEPEYNYIHFRYDNIWTVSALVNYEIVDNGQNIKFEILPNTNSAMLISITRRKSMRWASISCF